MTIQIYTTFYFNCENIWKIEGSLGQRLFGAFLTTLSQMYGSQPENHHETSGTKYSWMDQVKFVEDSP